MQAITINNNHFNEHMCFSPLPHTVVNFQDHYIESLLITCHSAAKCGWTNQGCWQAVSRHSLNHFRHGWLLLELKLAWQAEVLGRASQNESHVKLALSLLFIHIHGLFHAQILFQSLHGNIHFHFQCLTAPLCSVVEQCLPTKRKKDC